MQINPKAMTTKDIKDEIKALKHDLRLQDEGIVGASYNAEMNLIKLEDELARRKT